MRSGPDLDAEIARILWGYIVVLDVGTGQYTMISATGHEMVPPYSSSKDAVEQVKEYYQDKGWRLRSRRDGDGYVAAFVRKGGSQYRYIAAESLPEAICRAALAIEDGSNIQLK